MYSPFEAPDAFAWHEAGHAAVAHWLGGSVRWVTLESDDDDLAGHSEVEWPSADAETAATRSACTALAGPLAELSFAGEDILADASVLQAWGRDWAEVERALDAVTHDEAARRTRVYSWIRETMIWFDNPNSREVVARVADALSAHGTLDRTLFEECFE